MYDYRVDLAQPVAELHSERRLSCSQSRPPVPPSPIMELAGARLPAPEAGPAGREGKGEHR